MNTPALRIAVLLLSLASATSAHADWPRDPSAAAPVAQGPGDQDALACAGDELGGVWFAFEDHASDPLTHVRVQHLDLYGRPMFGDTGLVISAPDARQNAPCLVPDGTGGAFVTWVDFRADTAGDLHAQRITREGAPAWAGTGVAVCAVPAAHARSVVLAPGDSLDAYVAWQDDRAGAAAQNIYAQRIGRDGALLWAPANGLAVAPESSSQSTPYIFATTLGALFAWTDWRSLTYWNVYAQRFDRQGHPAWVTNGVEICAYPAHEYEPCAVGASDGSFFIAWLDRRPGWLQVIAQRVSAGGTVLGPTDGLPVSGTQAPVFSVHLVRTAGPGVIVAWGMVAGSGLQVAGQRFDGTFTSQWGTNGLTLLDVQDQMGVNSWDAEDDRNDGLYLAAATGSYGAYDIVGEHYGPGGASRWPGGVTIRHGGDVWRRQVSVAHSGADMIVGWDGADPVSGWNLAANLVGAGGVLTVPAPAPPGAATFFARPSPSPVSGGATLTLRFSSPSARAVRIELIDLAGRSIRRESYNAPAGASSFPLAVRDAGGRPLAPGIYMVRASASDGAASAHPVVVLR